MLFSGLWRLEMLKNQCFELYMYEKLKNQASKGLDKFDFLYIIRLVKTFTGGGRHERGSTFLWRR